MVSSVHPDRQIHNINIFPSVVTRPEQLARVSSHVLVLCQYSRYKQDATVLGQAKTTTLQSTSLDLSGKRAASERALRNATKVECAASECLMAKSALEIPGLEKLDDEVANNCATHVSMLSH